MGSKGFWGKIKKPILALAPMADVTDFAFREIVAKYGKPDVMFTEFVSCDGLLSDGKKAIMIDLRYSEAERPIVAQVVGSDPKNFKKAVTIIEDLGFDSIDINMGCPDKSIEKQGAGAALIKNPVLARKIISAVKEYASIPVSIKTRIGYYKDETEKWISELLKENPSVITIHLRTRKEMSKVPAKWSCAKKAVEIRDRVGCDTLIIGNGDVKSVSEAKDKVKDTGVDGVMVGRGVFGNPWFFRDMDKNSIGIKRRLEVMVEHTILFEEVFKDIKNFSIMKKHFKAYVSGFKGAKSLRMKLMESKNAEEVRYIVEDFLT